MRALDGLLELKRRRDPQAVARVERLLARLARTRFRDHASLIRLHETTLFLRAYPHSPRALRLADRILFSFGKRMRGLDLAPFDDAEISGFAGTTIVTNFSYEIAQSLAARHGRSVRIDWDNFERPERMGAALARLIPLAGEDWTVEPHVNWKRWFESAHGTLAWLLEHIDSEMYDLIEVPLRWDLNDSAAVRARTRIPRREIFYHRGPLLERRDISLEAEFAAPPIPVTKLNRRRAENILGVIVDTSAVRFRELYGFTHPDLAHVYHADLGRGVDIFFFGVPDRWRLPLRAYHAGMYFKNGVPVGYVEGLSLFERMEVGFNLYYTFREGETAWLFARVLKLFRERLGVTCYSLDSYQLGLDNDEAIESGAFWFYRKLGFRSSSPMIERLARREEVRIRAHPAYRTKPAMLRRLAQAPLIYGGGHEWDRFMVRNLRGKKFELPEDVRLAKHAPEETGYLRLLQRHKILRARLLRLGLSVVA